MSTSIPAGTLEKFTTFGELLRFLRRRAGITQLELSIAVGYSDAQISRLEQNLRLPDIPTIEARFVSALDLEAEPKAVARLLDLAANVRREDAPGLGVSPYKGLNYFDEADAELFIGREELTGSLTGRIVSMVSGRNPATERFLAIVGASGSGKSSLVRAGLVPALRWNQVSASWPIHVLTPTAHPLESLAASLTGDSGSVLATSALLDDMKSDPRSLHLFIKRLLNNRSASGFLLVIDQFEELFTLCRSEEERGLFIDNLLTAASEPGGPTMVVIALRADFYAHCANYIQLRQALARGQEYIGAMSEGDLRRAIEEPARRGRWEFEPGLVDLLLHDVGREPGALPLLSHALLETWQRRRGRTMTLSGYTSSGGVRGAIAETAEAVFADQFTREQQDIARRIFLRLTELGDETATGDTRRRASIDELTLSAEEAGPIGSVLKILADARLITTSAEAVEVAHEALIREWPTLRGWLEDNREGLRLHRHLTEASQEWAKLGKEPDLLYRGARLTQAQEWGRTHDEEMNTLEREFLAVSTQAREQEANEREAQRQRELEAARMLAEEQRQRAEEQARSTRQLNKRARYLTGAFLVALVMAFTALFFGSQARQTAVRAQDDRRIALGRELSASSLNNLAVDPERSILLSLQAVSTTRSVDGTVLPEAEEALHRAIMASPVRLSIRGQGTKVLSAAFSPDGRQLSTIGIDGTVVVWDAMSGEELLRVPGTTEPGDLVSANRIAYSPDGKQIIACDRGMVKIYDALSGNLISQLEGHQANVLAVAISPDGKLIASGDQAGEVRVWDAASGRSLHVLAGHKDWIESLAFSPDGMWLATGSNDKTMKIWNVSTGELVQDHEGFEAVIDSIAFSPDGTQIAFTDGSIHVWGFEVNSVEGKATIATREILVIPTAIYVKFSPDGKSLASVSGPTQASVWDAATGRELLTLVGHTDWVMGLAFSPDGKSLASTSLDGTIRVWSLMAGQETVTVSGPGAGYGTRVVYNPNGQEFATNGGDGTATIWDAQTGELRLKLAGHEQEVLNIAFSPDGKRFATCSLDATAIVWDAASGKKLLTLTGHEVGVRDIAFSPDGRLIATGGFDNTARIWDGATGSQLLKITGHEGLVVGVAFSPDGTRLATASTDTTAKVWDVKSGKLIFTLTGHVAPVTDIAYSPDGSKIATGSPDGTARIWDAATGKELLMLSGQGTEIRAIAFSLDGKSLATGSGDNTATIWDVATGSAVVTLPGSAGGVYGVAFSPTDGGAHLLVASNDGVVRTFLLRIEDLQALARSRVTRSFTTGECRKYLHLDECPVIDAGG